MLWFILGPPPIQSAGSQTWFHCLTLSKLFNKLLELNLL